MKKMKKFLIIAASTIFALSISLSLSPLVSAATFDQSGCNAVTYYDVGPGKQYTNLSELPWSQFGGCVTVRVYPKVNNEPYREQVLLSAGTNLTPTAANKWFRLQGMPDANGTLPIISGENSTQKETIKVNGVDKVQSLQYSDVNNPQYRALYKLGVITIWGQLGAKYGSDTAQNIMVDHLQISESSDLYSVKDEVTNQMVQRNGFSSGIYGIGKHLIFQDNIITNNGNGIFINSKDNFYNSEDLLVRGNYFTNNGRAADFHEHHMYVQTMGPEIVEYNFFGMGRPGSHPQAYKTRSANSIFRYNTVVADPAETNDNCLVSKTRCGIQQALWYSEPDGSPISIKAAPNYNKALVYGNTFIDKADGQGLLFTDRDSASTVYFYNNTYLAKRKPTSEILLFMNPIGTKIEARNNIFASEPIAAGSLPTTLVFEGSADNGGNVNLVNNVVTTKTLEFWPYHHPPGSTTTVTGFASNIIIPNNDNTLVFNDIANNDLHLKAGSPAINAAAALNPIVLALGNIVDKEYVSLGVTKPRASSVDVGAFAFTGQGGAISPPPSPPAGGSNGSGSTNNGGNSAGNGSTSGNTTAISAPVLKIISPIPTSSVDTTPVFVFNSDKSGVIKFSSECPVANIANYSPVNAGNISVEFGPLNIGSYTNCSILVANSSTSLSAPLYIGNFMVVANSGNTGSNTGNSSNTSNNTDNNNTNNTGNNTADIGSYKDCLLAGYQDITENCHMYLKVQELGLFDEASYFRPDDLLDRSQMLKLTEKMTHTFRSDYDYCKGKTYYSDVSGDDWAEQLICFATQKGFISGSNGKFAPYKKVNLAELAKMIGVQTKLSKTLIESSKRSKNWYDPYIYLLTSNKILSNSTPDRNITRGQAVKIFYNLWAKGYIK